MSDQFQCKRKQSNASKAMLLKMLLTTGKYIIGVAPGSFSPIRNPFRVTRGSYFFLQRNGKPGVGVALRSPRSPGANFVQKWKAKNANNTRNQVNQKHQKRWHPRVRLVYFGLLRAKQKQTLCRNAKQK